MDYILALDQGTTATTAIIMNHLGQTVAESSVELEQHFPKPGLVEHYDHEIKECVKIAITKALENAKLKPSALCGIGITNQRETVCLFDHESKAAFPFIVWQCRRSAPLCEALKARGLEDFFHKKTGLYLDPYFSATKLLWLFQNHPALLKRAQKKELLFGTIDTYLCHWFSQGELHITDVTNASRTMLMDLTSLKWDEECLDIFSFPKQMLPTIVKNVGPFGKTKGLDFLPDGIPLAAIAGDQQAALFGQACFFEGEAKATFGTGSFILLNTGTNLVFSKQGLITSVAYQIDRKPFYCLEGSAFIAGALVQFLRDNLGIIDHAEDIDNLAALVPDNGGVVFVPALCGLGAPYWRSSARGLISGLDRGTKKAHIARAALEGIALQNTDIVQAMAQDTFTIDSLRVDGGVSKSDLLMSIQADLLGVPCIRSTTSQKTAEGVAYLAGLALGIFKDQAELKKLSKDGEQFIPKKERSHTAALLKNYHEAVKKA